MSDLPKHANVVVIGAGIVGNSIAHHLARLGWKDMVLVEKGPFPNPGGSTGHASNFIYLVDHSKEMTKFTLTDKKALRAEILHVRKQGYAVTAQELRRGYHAVAVPLRRFDGATIAAVCVAVWLEDSSVGTSAEKYLAALREETEALQAQLL